MFIIRRKKIFIGISVFLTLISIISVLVYGFRPGIEFKGGSLAEVVYPQGRPEATQVEHSLAELSLGTILVQPTGDNGYIIKTRDVNETEHQKLMQALSFGGTVEVQEKNFTTIGPSVGQELARKAVVAVILVILFIVLFIAYAFRKVSEPVSSWKYGIITMAALIHDVIIPIGMFSAISHYTGAEVDTLFVVAVLTILGLSISDTIVVFDRVRENLNFNRDNNIQEQFEATVGKSVTQTFTRSINTSLTVILVLLALLNWGPESTRNFALVMTAGMFFGTYSSIFLAAPLLVWTESTQHKKSSK